MEIELNNPTDLEDLRKSLPDGVFVSISIDDSGVVTINPQCCGGVNPLMVSDALELALKIHRQKMKLPAYR